MEKVRRHSLRYTARVGRLQASPTLAAAAAVRKQVLSGEDIVRFDVGEPDFDTPDHIREAAIEAIRKGFTHYTSARGIPELADALVQHLGSDGVDAQPSNIAFYPGSKLSLYSVLSLLVGEGERALVQDPVWPTYGSIVEYLGGESVPIKSWDEKDPDHFPVEHFVDELTENTKVVVVNSPCNPTGSVGGKDPLEDLARECHSRGVVLLLDRIYSALTYDGAAEKAPAGDLEGGDFVIVSGFSKEFAMTGWRLGYTVASKDFTDRLARVVDNTATCAPSFVQKAAVAALTGETSWQERMNREYVERRDLMVAEMKRIPGWSCAPPRGAFYCFPKVDASDSAALSGALLKEAKVSSVAGVYFGPSGEGHLRLSYTTPKERIAEGMKRIRDAVESTGAR